MHAFWFASIVPGFVMLVVILKSFRIVWLWGAAVIGGFVYLGIFSFPFVQGIVAGGSVPDDWLARVVYQLIVTSDLPLVQGLTASLLNLLLVVFFLKPGPENSAAEKSSES